MNDVICIEEIKNKISKNLQILLLKTVFIFFKNDLMFFCNLLTVELMRMLKEKNGLYYN